MSFLEHVEVLRWHLIRSVVAILLAAIAFFVYSRWIFDNLIFSLADSDFWTYVKFCQLSEALGLGDKLCFEDIDINFQNIKMSGQISTDIVVALVGGFIVAFPYVLWEIWRFVKPGLTKKEQRGAAGTVMIGSLLFVVGILFAYYVIAPLSVQFLANYKISERVVNNITLNSYITTVTTIILACGIIYQLPLVVYFLSKIGLMTPEFMKRYRKHAIVLTLVLSAIITPPDISSQLLVSIPLMLLYEASISISRVVNKNLVKNNG